MPKRTIQTTIADYFHKRSRTDDLDFTQIGGGKYKIKKIRDNKVEDFELYDAFYELESNDDSPSTFHDAIKSLNEFFKEIHSKFVSVLKKNQMIHISFNHDNLRYPISIGYLNKEDMTVEM